MPGFWRHRLLLKSFILICVVRGVQTTVNEAGPGQHSPWLTAQFLMLLNSCYTPSGCVSWPVGLSHLHLTPGGVCRQVPLSEAIMMWLQKAWNFGCRVILQHLPLPGMPSPTVHCFSVTSKAGCFWSHRQLDRFLSSGLTAALSLSDAALVQVFVGGMMR